MADNDAVHRAGGVCYPHTGRATHGYRNHLPLARSAPGDLTDAINAIRAEAEAKDCHTIVLSCEEWANAFPRGNLMSLCAALAQEMAGWDLRVLAYFRNPFDFVESCYAQYVLAGLLQISRHQFYADGKPSIEKFLALFAANRGFPLYSNLGFARMLHRGLPQGTIRFRSYEPSDLGTGGILADFCDQARVAAPPHSLPPVNTRLSNRKLAELEYVQTLVDQNTYAALRDRLLAHEFPRLINADNRRTTTLHIGAELANAITQQIEQDSATMGQMFHTPTAALCAVPHPDWARHNVLSARDRANLAAFIARHTDT